MNSPSRNFKSRSSSCHVMQSNDQNDYEQTEIDFFGTELSRIKETIEQSLMTRRLNKLNEDPLEEIKEIYADVQIME